MHLNHTFNGCLPGSGALYGLTGHVRFDRSRSGFQPFSNLLKASQKDVLLSHSSVRLDQPHNGVVRLPVLLRSEGKFGQGHILGFVLGVLDLHEDLGIRMIQKRVLGTANTTELIHKKQKRKGGHFGRWRKQTDCPPSHFGIYSLACKMLSNRTVTIINFYLFKNGGGRRLLGFTFHIFDDSGLQAQNNEVMYVLYTEKLFLKLQREKDCKNY